MKLRLTIILFILLALCNACWGTVYYEDPLLIGTGARSIAMGSAFVALSDDSDAIYMNPAGLGEQRDWDLSTMNTSLLDEYQYLMLSGVYPTEGGAFGARFVQSRIGGIIPTGGGDMAYYNQALVLSYGSDISGSMSKVIGEDQKVYGGLSFKYYTEGFTGVDEATGRGYNLDVGLKYVPCNWISYGMAVQNIFPGAQITGDFEPEDMYLVTKIGAAFHWLERGVVFALDKDFYPGRPTVACPGHLGIEWRAHQFLYLRAGLDQVLGSSGDGDLLTNTTYGIGFDYNGVRIDLAQMQNFAALNMSSSVVSISFYGGPIFAEKNPEKNAPANNITESPMNFERQYLVVAGRNMSHDEAVKIASALSEKGYKAHLNLLENNSYEVHVDSFNSKENAEYFSEKLKNEGFNPEVITRN